MLRAELRVLDALEMSYLLVSSKGLGHGVFIPVDAGSIPVTNPIALVSGHPSNQGGISARCDRMLARPLAA